MSELLVFFERIAHSLIFLLKTIDSLGKPWSKFPALFKPSRIYEYSSVGVVGRAVGAYAGDTRLDSRPGQD